MNTQDTKRHIHGNHHGSLSQFTPPNKKPKLSPKKEGTDMALLGQSEVSSQNQTPVLRLEDYATSFNGMNVRGITPECVARTTSGNTETRCVHNNDYAIALALQRSAQFVPDIIFPSTAPRPRSAPEIKIDEEQSALFLETSFNFVSALVAQHKKLTGPPMSFSENFCNFSPVSTDAMVSMVERLLKKRQEFHREGKPTDVDVGFHYTTRSGMVDIKTHGLMTQKERRAMGIKAPFHGATFGDGIYTASNPFGYHDFAAQRTREDMIGIFVLRLCGESKVHDLNPASSKVQQEGRHSEADALHARDGLTATTVLRSSHQCVPLVQFLSGVVSPIVDSSAKADLSDRPNSNHAASSPSTNTSFGTVGNDMVEKYRKLLAETLDVHINHNPDLLKDR